jgi:glucosamine-6-phosphate deaminase
MSNLNLDRRVKPSVFLGDTAEECGKIAADVIARQLGARADSVLALPTGATPLPLYAELSRRCAEGLISFAEVHSFNLDEYVGLSPENTASYHAYMLEHLFSKVDIDMANIRIPNGLATDLDEECARFERDISALGGLDLAVVGLGVNGHLGFNEPGTPFDVRTHVTALAPETVAQHVQYFGDARSVPKSAITMGTGTVLEAKRILLIATGQSKAAALKAAFEGPITTEVPASVLQAHPHVTIVIDRAAASLLEKLGK